MLVDPSTKVDLRDLYRRSSQFLGIDDYVKIATVIDIDAITNLGNVTIETPSRKAFEIEGAILKQALSDCLRNQRAVLEQLWRPRLHRSGLGTEFSNAAYVKMRIDRFPTDLRVAV